MKQSPLTDSNRRPPPYHGTSQAIGRSRDRRQVPPSKSGTVRATRSSVPLVFPYLRSSLSAGIVPPSRHGRLVADRRLSTGMRRFVLAALLAALCVAVSGGVASSASRSSAPNREQVRLTPAD